MTDSRSRPPYLAALAVIAVILLGFLLTLAPTVTFWDAGELISATRILGIPHPPGTPLLVLLGHAFATLVPLGEWAFRTNLMTAAFSAAAGGLFFLVVHESLRSVDAEAPGDDATWRLLTSAAAAIVGVFTFTNWQNSTETEAYSVAVFTIAAMCWLALRWRAVRGTERAPRLLLLVLFLAGLSVGNHLLALLAGPSIVVFLAYTLRRAPAADAVQRRQEWAKVAVVAGTWALVIGSGLGSTTLTVLGVVCYLGALVLALGAGVGGWALLALLVAAIGITPYLFLFIRAGQHPMVNEADPSTWDALLAVIRRAQYPVRTPLDDPTIPHGPDNPGRSLQIIGLQLANYFQYFDWQWARSIPQGVRAAFTVLFLSLGVRGSLAQRRADRGAWWLLAVLFLVTGLGLVAYMNFKPGFGIGYGLYPSADDHEVRDRDYFFVVSFVVWGLWAGVGIGDLARRLAARTGVARGAAYASFALVALPVALNWREASRRGPDRTLAADFAYNLLNSVPPYGILFTYGDNDTFPLWWAQEVAGIRRDVTVVCLALAQTDWYMRQLRDNPLGDFDPEAAPPPWRGAMVSKPDWPLHTMTDADIATASTTPVLLERPTTIPFGPISRTYPERTVFYPNDVVSLRIIQQNIGRRPIVWGVTSGREFAGLGEYVVQQGLAFRLETARPDTTRPGIVSGGMSGAALDLPLTTELLWSTYRYGPLPEEAGGRRLDPTSAGIASTMSIPFTLLAYQASLVADSAGVVKHLQRAQQLAPDEAIARSLEAFRPAAGR
ncbi:MAG: DUF2723 domain-containing protein [Gemmatimonadales bacterium]|nr:DUF2723 domain-containing protein [Gemmatimonadales bacterium]